MNRLYIATAIGALLVALMMQLPARVAWQWWSKDAAASQIYLTGIKGTLFQGQAAGLFVQSLSVNQLQWNGHVWPLLTARMRFDITGSLEDYPLEAVITLGPTGSVHLADADAALPVKWLAPLLQLPVMPLDGLLRAHIKDLKLADNQVLRAAGKLELHNSEWLLVRPPVALGNLQADISTEDEVISAELGSSGALQLKGQSRLNADGTYETDIRLRSGADADSRLENLLKTLGQPVDGWYRIKTRGKLPERS